MKRNILVFLLSIFMTISIYSNSQIPNGDFSNWSLDSIGRMDLTGWNTSNVMYNAPGLLQDTDRLGGSGNSGKFVITFDSALMDYAFTVMNLVHAPFSGPVRPSILSGYWKLYNPLSNDGLSVEIWLYDSLNNQIGHAGTTTPLNGSIPNWTQFSRNITYSTNDPVASYSIEIFLYNLSHQDVCYGYLDDLSFDVSTSIEETKNNLYANVQTLGESKYLLNISQDSPINIVTEIFDLAGRQMMIIPCSTGQTQSLEIDLSSFPVGIYFCRISNGKSNKSIRLIKLE